MNSFRFLQRGVEAELERQRELIGGGGDGDPGDPPLRPGQRQPHLAALEGGIPRLPLLPRARPGAAGADRGDAARGPRGAAGAAGGADRALRRRWAWRPTSPPTLATDPATAAYFERTWAAAEGSSRRSSPTGSPASSPRRCARATRRSPRPTPRSSPRRWPPWSTLVQEKKISHGSGKTVLAALVAEGGDPAAIVEREGLAQISDSGELESIVAAAVEANPEAAEQIRSRQRQGDRRHRRRGDEGDQGPRRRRRGQPPDPGATGL